MVHAAAKHDKDVGGGTGFTKATALLHLQQRGLSTAVRVEAVQRALANDPPRLHPLLAIIGRSMLMSLTHEIFLGLLKSFMHDVEAALKRQSLGAPHLFRSFTFLLDKNGQLNYNIDITEPKAWIF